VAESEAAITSSMGRMPSAYRAAQGVIEILIRSMRALMAGL
jgi:hypothetical protein